MTKSLICGKIRIVLLLRKVRFLKYKFKKMLMVNEEINNSNANTGKRTGILAAFRAMFSSADEKSDKDMDSSIKAEVKKLDAESKGSIESLTSRLYPQEQSRENFSKTLKPTKIEKINDKVDKPIKKGKNAKTFEKQEDDGEREL